MVFGRFSIGVRHFRTAFGCFRTAFGYFRMAFGCFQMAFAWLRTYSFRTALGYRGRLVADLDGFSPTTHTRFLKHFFEGREAPGMKQTIFFGTSNDAGRTSNTAGRTSKMA